MSNQPRPVNRSLAFWFGLALHLALGVAIYYHITTPKAAKPAVELNQTQDGV